MNMKKPRLFLDIDGVLYAHYGGAWQLRPFIATLTKWAEQHFDVYYVSFNSRRAQVVSVAYGSGMVLMDWDGSTDWHPKAEQSQKLIPIFNNGGIAEDDWILIEDEPPDDVQQEILRDFGREKNWLVIPDTGMSELLDVKTALEGWLLKKELIVPFEWATRKVEKRDLWCGAHWQGYGNYDPEKRWKK